MSGRGNLHSTHTWRKVAGTTIVILFGIAAAGYYAFASTSRSDESKKVTVKKTSQCYLITTSLCNSTKMDWRSILDNDVLLLVAPGVKFLSAEDDALRDNYKIVHCDTISGIWSCVRHLGKDQFIYDSSDLEDGIPSDIPRYVKEIINLKKED